MYSTFYCKYDNIIIYIIICSTNLLTSFCKTEFSVELASPDADVVGTVTAVWPNHMLNGQSHETKNENIS